MHVPCRRIDVGKKKQALVLFEDEERNERERALLRSIHERNGGVKTTTTTTLGQTATTAASVSNTIHPPDSAIRTGSNMFPPLQPGRAPQPPKTYRSKTSKAVTRKLNKLTPMETARHQAGVAHTEQKSTAITELMRVLATELSLFPSPEQMRDIKDPLNVVSSLPACEQRVRVLNQCFDRVVTEGSPFHRFLALWKHEYQAQCELLRSTVDGVTSLVWRLEEDVTVLKGKVASPTRLEVPMREVAETEASLDGADGADATTDTCSVEDNVDSEECEELEPSEFGLDVDPMGLPKYSFEESEPGTPVQAQRRGTNPRTTRRRSTVVAKKKSVAGDTAALQEALFEIERLKETMVPRQQYKQLQKMVEKMSKKLQLVTEEAKSKLQTLSEEKAVLETRLQEESEKTLRIVSDTEDQKRQQVAAVRMIMATKLATKRALTVETGVSASVPVRDHGTSTDPPVYPMEGHPHPHPHPHRTDSDGHVHLPRRGSAINLSRRNSGTPVAVARKPSLQLEDSFVIKRSARSMKDLSRAQSMRDIPKTAVDEGVQTDPVTSPDPERKALRHSLFSSPVEKPPPSPAEEAPTLDVKHAAEYRLVDIVPPTPAAEILQSLAAVKGLPGRLWDKRDLAVLEHDAAIVSERGALNGLHRDLGVVAYLASTTLCKAVTWAVSVNGDVWTLVASDTELEHVRRNAGADEPLLLSDALNTTLGSDWGTMYTPRAHTSWGVEHYSFEEVDLVRYSNPMNGPLYHDTVLWAVAGLDPAQWIPSDIVEYVHSLPCTESTKRDRWEVLPLSDPELRSVQLRCSTWQGSDVERRELHRLTAKVLHQDAEVSFGSISVARASILELVEEATRDRQCSPSLLARVLRLQVLVYKKVVYVLALTTSPGESAYMLDTTTKTVHSMQRHCAPHPHQPVTIANAGLNAETTPVVDVTHQQYGGRYTCCNTDVRDVVGLAFRRNDLVARWTGARFSITRSGEEVCTLGTDVVSVDIGSWMLPKLMPLVGALYRLCDRLRSGSEETTTVYRDLAPQDSPWATLFRISDAVRWNGFTFAHTNSSPDHGAQVTIHSTSAVPLERCSRFSRVPIYLIPPVPFQVKELVTRPQVGITLQQMSEKEACSATLRGMISRSDIDVPDGLIQLWQQSADPSGTLRTLLTSHDGGYVESVSRQLIRAGASYDVLFEHLLENLVSGAQTARILQCGCAATVVEPSTGKTVLQIACERGHADSARVLLSSGAMPPTADGKAEALFACIASMAGDEAGLYVMRCLCTEEVLSLKDAEGCTPLLAAVKSGCVAVVKLMTAVGSDRPEDALDLAMQLSDLPAVMHLEQHIGVSLTMEDFPDYPLHLASVRNRPDAVAPLLHYGFDPNAYDANGRTPLDIALQQSHDEVAKVLRAVTISTPQFS